MSALIYLWKDGALSAFVAPRYAYTRTTVSPPSGESRMTAHGASGSFGAQYAVGHKFSVSCDVGVAYSHLAVATIAGGATVVLPPGAIVSTSRSETTGHSVGIRTTVGGVLYFR
jgi:hypothetical protein